jgi:hypothetical protein
MSVRRVPSDPGATQEVPEADAVEQQIDVLEVTDPLGVDDAERVVNLDDDEYR